MFFRTILRMFTRHRFLLPCRSPLVRSCQFSSPLMQMCRDRVYEDLLQRDEQIFVWQRGATELIVKHAKLVIKNCSVCATSECTRKLTNAM